MHRGRWIQKAFVFRIIVCNFLCTYTYNIFCQFSLPQYEAITPKYPLRTIQWLWTEVVVKPIKISLKPKSTSVLRTTTKKNELSDKMRSPALVDRAQQHRISHLYNNSTSFRCLECSSCNARVTARKHAPCTSPSRRAVRLLHMQTCSVILCTRDDWCGRRAGAISTSDHAATALLAHYPDA